MANNYIAQPQRSKWGILSENLNTSNPSGYRGVSSALLSGLKAYGGIRGSIEDQEAQSKYQKALQEQSQQAALSEAQKEAEQQAYERDLANRKLKAQYDIAGIRAAGQAATGMGSSALPQGMSPYFTEQAQKTAGKQYGEATGDIMAQTAKKSQELKDINDLISENQNIAKAYDESVGGVEGYSKQTGLERRAGSLLRGIGFGVGESPKEAEARTAFDVNKEARVNQLYQTLKGSGQITEEELNRVAKSALGSKNPYELDIVLQQGKKLLEKRMQQPTEQPIEQKGSQGVDPLGIL